MYLKEKKMKSTTTRLAGPEKSYSKQALETMIGSFLRKVKKKKKKKKKRRSGEVLNQSTKQLETSEKHNSPTNWNINSNQDMPRGHDLWSAATTHLM